jgi:hypothetical protein
VFRKDALAERLDFAESNSLEATRAFKAEREPTDAGKEV